MVFPPGGGVGYRFGKAVTTDEFEDWKPIDEQMAFDERVRLLYVACTRAKDHLVLSLQRKVRARAARAVQAHQRRAAPRRHRRRRPRPPARRRRPRGRGRRGRPAPRPRRRPPPFAEWRAELDAALAAGSRPTTVAATALTAEGTPDPARDEPDADPTRVPTWMPARAATVRAEADDAEPSEAGLQKRPRDLDLPPWLKGRYGTAVGRAVHGTLQTIDLADPTGLAGAVAAQCEAEAIVERATEVEGLVRAALASPVIAAATAGPHWREVYACTPTPGGRLLEGYIDLLYRTPDGMVIVDYKTAATNDPAELRPARRRLPPPGRRPTRWPSARPPASPSPGSASPSSPRPVPSSSTSTTSRPPSARSKPSSPPAPNRSSPDPGARSGSDARSRQRKQVVRKDRSGGVITWSPAAPMRVLTSSWVSPRASISAVFAPVVATFAT